VPVDDRNLGAEIVLMIRSQNVKNDKNIFYTDDNGYLMQKRQRDYREGYQQNYTGNEPANYYPITSTIYMQNPETKQTLGVLTDRPQGATSLQPGEIEIMIHRVCAADDSRGVGEVLREQEDIFYGDPSQSLLHVSTRHYLHYSLPGKN
jgi:hypothetical protein